MHSGQQIRILHFKSCALFSVHKNFGRFSKLKVYSVVRKYSCIKSHYGTEYRKRIKKTNLKPIKTWKYSKTKPAVSFQQRHTLDSLP